MKYPLAAPTVMYGLLLLLAACSNNTNEDSTTTDTTADTANIADTTFGFDTTPAEDTTKPDVTPIFDVGDTADDTTAGPSCDEPACPGEARCPCAENSDCDLGYCVDTPVGRRCADTCVDSCCDGERCRQVTVAGGDLVSLCVPAWPSLCDPCTASSACEGLGVSGGLCVDHGEAGAFCGAACADAGDCPEAFTCTDVETIEGNAAKQCVPTKTAGGSGDASPYGSCGCSPAAIDQGLATACVVTATLESGEAVSCAGTRQCTDDGLSACAAPDIGEEVCDGLDNDCNGQVDDLACDDDNVCTLDKCQAGGCAHNPVPDGLPCDADGTDCTEGDACAAGQCQPGAVKSCDDGNPCTKDTCDLATGCTQVADDGAPCDDENPCTLGDVCAGKQCQAGTPKDCQPFDQCTGAKCNFTSGACEPVELAAGTPCDDGNACTSDDGCEAGLCAGTNITCDDANPCTNDSCKPADGCAYVANADPCDDGNACTKADTCADKTCAGTPLAAADCDDGNPCTDDACDMATGCTHTDNAAACDDDNACTTSDACEGGSCKPGAPLVCDDGKYCNGSESCNPASGCQDGPAPKLDDGLACTLDACDEDGDVVTHTPQDSACDDGQFCNGAESCDGAKGCQPGVAPPLSDGVPCTVDSCDEALDAVLHTPADALCDDGAFCNGAELCDANSGCMAGPPPVLDDGVACTADSCDEASDAVVHLPQQDSCADGNVCTDNTCDPQQGCVTTSNSEPCDDGNACTAADTCSGGDCEGTPLVAADDCDDGNVCTDESCDPVDGCLSLPNKLSCVDGDACTESEVCADGACVTQAVDCDDGNPCTVDSCDVATGCANAAAADETPCGGDSSQWCQAGVCVDKAPPGMVLIPAGDFWMGCNAAKDGSCQPSEKPQHKVTLSAYYMDRDEVTVDDYAACEVAGACSKMGLTKDNTCNWGKGGKGSHPINCVDWYQASAYCAWADKRLPTEAEWEKAARGGCETVAGDCKTGMRTYPWGEAAASCTYAVFDQEGIDGSGCGTGGTLPVGSKSPAGDGPYGLRDMSGNVSEWCADSYDNSYYEASPSQDPKGPAGPKHIRVIRGGSWTLFGNVLRAAYRNGFTPDYRINYTGFRCARTP